MGMAKAEKACNEKRASLFVADSIEEFNVVMKETPLYYWSWMGLGQGATDTYPKWGVSGAYNPSSFRCVVSDDVNQLDWAGYGGMDPSQLKWLVQPFSSAANGWSAAAMCVGYYNIDMFSSTYTYFYPCSSLFHSVCERNSTLINV